MLSRFSNKRYNCTGHDVLTWNILCHNKLYVIARNVLCHNMIIDFDNVKPLTL